MKLPPFLSSQSFLRFPRILTLTALTAFASMTGNGLGADQPSPAEAKLRESLRATMLQLRTAQAERATLQATQAEFEAKNKTLTEQLETANKQAAASQAEAEKSIAELNRKVDERDREIGSLRVSLDKWKADHTKITNIATATEAQRAKLADQVIFLERRVADQRTKNQAMHKLGLEILSRYEKFGLGTALTAREPFVGRTRVKFENLIQEYGDKLAEQRIKSDESTPAVETKRSQPAKREAATR